MFEEKKKQEAHGPHHLHENQFTSKNTFEQSYDYIITSIMDVLHVTYVIMLRKRWTSMICANYFRNACVKN